MPVLSGKNLAKKRAESFKKRVQNLKVRPHLVVVLVGDDPASKVYVGHKEKQCAEVGIKSTIVRLNAQITSQDLEAEINKLNQDKNVDGVLVQLPLPKALADFDPSDFIAPQKDVDGLTATNMGLMIKNKAYAESCTPKGVIELLKENKITMAGKNAVVIGRSQIVGWPMAWMLTRENATVTVCHSHTKNLKQIIKDAEIIVVAAGKPEFLSVEDFSQNAVVVDVGIHRNQDGKLVGDVDTKNFETKNISFTPVPGGVGPMTVSQLLDNVISICERK